MHTDRIDDKILAEIRRSGLLVADFTGHRQGVYFEAGFALGLDVPVIWCCREDEIEKAHFEHSAIQSPDLEHLCGHSGQTRS